VRRRVRIPGVEPFSSAPQTVEQVAEWRARTALRATAFFAYEAILDALRQHYSGEPDPLVTLVADGVLKGSQGSYCLTRDTRALFASVLDGIPTEPIIPTARELVAAVRS
jgi:hypothetical protein